MGTHLTHTAPSLPLRGSLPGEVSGGTSHAQAEKCSYLRAGLHPAHDREGLTVFEALRGDERRTERGLSACFESAEVGVWIDQTGGVCGGGRLGRWAGR